MDAGNEPLSDFKADTTDMNTSTPSQEAQYAKETYPITSTEETNSYTGEGARGELTAAEIDAEFTNEPPPPPAAGNYEYGLNQASNPSQPDWDNLDF